MVDNHEIAEQKLYLTVEAALLHVNNQIQTLLKIRQLIEAVTPQNVTETMNLVNSLMVENIEKSKKIILS